MFLLFFVFGRFPFTTKETYALFKNCRRNVVPSVGSLCENSLVEQVKPNICVAPMHIVHSERLEKFLQVICFVLKWSINNDFSAIKICFKISLASDEFVNKREREGTYL